MENTNNTSPTPEPELLSEKLTAAKLDCSTRHVRRLADAGKMPRPIRLGGSIKWRRSELDAWIADGCPRVRIVRGGAA